ncbi:MAG: arginine--tRNA ligase, partial [Acidimicrobiales bacterium]
MTSTHDLLSARLHEAFGRVAAGADPVLRASERADYQANGALALATALGRAPREVAEAVVAGLEIADLATPEVAGPGFINLTLTRGYLSRALAALLGDPRMGLAPTASAHRVVIDYSSANVAKEMHV